MTIRKRRGSYYYRFWQASRLFEKGGFKTKRKAYQAEWQRRGEVGAVDKRAPVSLPFEGAVKRYLEEVSSKHVNAKHERYVLGRLMMERWCCRSLAAIKVEDIERYKSERLVSVKPATVNRELSYLSGLYTWAQRVGLVEPTVHPVRLVKREKETWRAWVILTPEQLERLFSYAPNRRERIKAELLYLLGVRRGVVLNMEWDRIDLGSRLLTYHSKGKDRTIPLSTRALELLIELGPQTSGRVFPEKTDSTLRRWWDKARKELGLPKLRRHDLRVTFARHLADRGVDPATIRDLLGHSTLTMTSRYIPPNIEQARRAVELLKTNRRDDRRAAS